MEKINLYVLMTPIYHAVHAAYLSRGTLDPEAARQAVGARAVFLEGSFRLWEGYRVVGLTLTPDSCPGSIRRDPRFNPVATEACPPGSHPWWTLKGADSRHDRPTPRLGSLVRHHEGGERVRLPAARRRGSLPHHRRRQELQLPRGGQGRAVVQASGGGDSIRREALGKGSLGKRHRSAQAGVRLPRRDITPATFTSPLLQRRGAFFRSAPSW